MGFWGLVNTWRLLVTNPAMLASRQKGGTLGYRSEFRAETWRQPARRLRPAMALCVCGRTSAPRKSVRSARKIHRALRLDFRAGAALETHYRHYDRRAAAGGLGEVPPGARGAGLRLR